MRRLATEALRAIVAAVEAEATRLHLLPPDQVYDLAAATSHAQGTEAAEAEWQAEMARWTGGVRADGLGVPAAAIPQSAPQTTVPARDFGHAGDLTGFEGHDESAILGVLYGAEEDRLDWLRAGEALSAAWLTSTSLGISLLPLSAAVEVAVTREAVRQLLAGLGHPYLALRLGTANADDAGIPQTPRLPTDQIIERVV